MIDDYYICVNGHVSRDLENPVCCGHFVSFVHDEMDVCLAELRKLRPHEVAAYKLGGPEAVSYGQR